MGNENKRRKPRGCYMIALECSRMSIFIPQTISDQEAEMTACAGIIRMNRNIGELQVKLATFDLSDC
ncbi:MAG: hypothetical protein AMDU1_APLC00046G0004 [Thermoplasmatales archaeon A-plasma]|jgi:hypothetical protein|nr:MAG: hypothetical protein AMDU1_APLC00046G0004 [Thermoplasmatales archaeon A-plasma]